MDSPCTHPECESEDTVLEIGPKREPYCIDHVDYGMGRAFGPLHAMLDAAEKAGLGTPNREGGDDGGA